MSGTPDSKTPGEVIAGARRQRGLSLEDLAERTKIPPTMLKAVEADEYHRLSDPLYARSFLRTCAKELGLVAEDILDLYARHLGEMPRQTGEPARVEEAVRIRRVGLPWARLSVGALAVVAVAVTAFILTRPGQDAPAQRTAAPVGSAAMTGPAARPRVGAAAETTIPSSTPTSEQSRAAEPVVEAPAGIPGLAFSDGLTWPLVVRLRVAAPITARARRDAEERFGDVVWPTSRVADPVPAAGITAGRAYGAGEDLFVYWGAVDRLSLVLGSSDLVELTVNGEPRPVYLPADGGEVILDLRAAPPASLQ